MDSTVPADLLKLKARLETWRAKRKYTRQPIPAALRQAVVAMAERYSPSLVRRVLRLDPWRLKKLSSKKPARARPRPQTTFFALPSAAAFTQPDSLAPPALTACRFQFERPDGARLILTLPTLELASTRQLCEDFLRA
jgi:hypothetical protein